MTALDLRHNTDPKQAVLIEACDADCGMIMQLKARKKKTADAEPWTPLSDERFEELN